MSTVLTHLRNEMSLLLRATLTLSYIGADPFNQRCLKDRRIKLSVLNTEFKA
jgi:hypothetical protein